MKIVKDPKKEYWNIFFIDIVKKLSYPLATDWINDWFIPAKPKKEKKAKKAKETPPKEE